MDPIVMEVFMHYKCMVLFKANGRNVHKLHNKLCNISCCLSSQHNHSTELNEALNWVYRETGILIDFEWYTKEKP